MEHLASTQVQGERVFGRAVTSPQPTNDSHASGSASDRLQAWAHWAEPVSLALSSSSEILAQAFRPTTRAVPKGHPERLALLSDGVPRRYCGSLTAKR